MRYLCWDFRALGSVESRCSLDGSPLLAAGGGAGASGGGWCRGDDGAVVERWLLRRWGRDDSALVDDSDRGSGGSALDAVGGRRVLTDCDRMGTSALAESVVAMAETHGGLVVEDSSGPLGRGGGVRSACCK